MCRRIFFAGIFAEFFAGIFAKILGRYRRSAWCLCTGLLLVVLLSSSGQGRASVAVRRDTVTTVRKKGISEKKPKHSPTYSPTYNPEYNTGYSPEHGPEYGPEYGLLADAIAGIDSDESAERAADLVEYYGELRRNPVNINSARRQEFQRLMLLDDFQIASLQRYVAEYGAILSFAELSLVHGFNDRIVALLKPYIYIGKAEPQGRSFYRSCSSDIYSRYQHKFDISAKSAKSADAPAISIFANTYGSVGYRFSGEDNAKGRSENSFDSPGNSLGNSLENSLGNSSGTASSQRHLSGSPDSFMLKYKADYSGKVEVSFILEKDAGERYDDYRSGSISINDIRFMKRKSRGLKADKIVIGDMSAKFGQGLTLWNSADFSSVDGSGGYSKCGAPLSGYTSSDETKGLRGAGATLSYGICSLTALYSLKGVDAKLDGRGFYTSIIKDGLHDTPARRAAKNSMSESLAGVRGEILFRRIRAGISYAGYSFDRHNGISERYYNARQQYDGYHSNIAADIYASCGNLVLFAECALGSEGNGLALLGGASWFSGGWNLNFLARLYSPDYIAPHAAAYSTISGVCNQQGGSFAAEGPLYGNLRLGLGAEYSFYPYYRYGIRASSSASKYYLRLFRSSFYDDNTVSFRVRYRRSAEYYSDSKLQHHADFALDAKWKLWDFLTVNGKGRYLFYSSSGTLSSVSPSAPESGRSFAYQVSAVMSIGEERLRLQAGATCYEADEWETRIYMWEPDLPQAFSSALLYGRGADLFGVLHIKLSRSLSLHLKARRRGNTVLFRTALRCRL